MRIVSWNIHSCRGLDNVVSVERVAETIAAHAPDLVGLNEVRRTPVLNQPRRLATQLGMPTAFQRNLVVPGLRFGNAVMTGGELLAYRSVPLPDGREPRGLLLTRVRVDGVELTFGVTHLGLSGPIRRAQKAIIERALPADGPVVLVGDFNEGPEALGALGRRLRLASPRPSFPAGAPARAIDFVLHSEHWETVSVDAPPTLASDHRAVIVDLAWRG